MTAVPDDDHRNLQACDTFHEIIGKPAVKQDAEHIFGFFHDFIGKTADLKILKLHTAFIEIELHIFPCPGRRITEIAGTVHIEEQNLAAPAVVRDAAFQESAAPDTAFQHPFPLQALQSLPQGDHAAIHAGNKLTFRSKLIARTQTILGDHIQNRKPCLIVFQLSSHKNHFPVS